MPNTDSRSWPKLRTFSLSLPASTSARWPTPKRISVRNAADSNLRATSVTSIVAGGSRQLSQLPQCSGGSSPKCRSRIARRQVGASTKAASAFSRSRSSGTALRLDLRLDPLAGTGEILGAPEQPGLRRLAVAAGAAGLLVIGLDRLRDAGMRDEADVGLVDAHAEGDRRGDHHVLGLHEGGLVARAHLRLETRVIRQRRPAAAGQLLGDLLGLVAARRIDDPGARLLSPATTSAARRARRADGRDSGCSAGRSRRRSGRRRECRAAPGCRRVCARRRSRSAPAAARPRWSSSSAAAADSRGGNRGPIR